METLVLIEGTLVNSAQHLQEGLASVSVKNEDGWFTFKFVGRHNLHVFGQVTP